MKCVAIRSKLTRKKFIRAIQNIHTTNIDTGHNSIGD